MDITKHFFGITSDKIKKNCIICQDLDQGFFLNFRSATTSKGIFFSLSNTESASVITVKNSFLIGDCVLSLKNTPCENIFLFASCAGIGDMEIGDAIIVENSYSFESFTRMARFEDKAEICYPNQDLFNRFLSYSIQKAVMPLNCATVSSLLLEEEYLERFEKDNISCVDMETSTIFSAAAKAGKSAISVLYVSDVIGKKSAFEPLSKSDQLKLGNSRKNFSDILYNFIKNDTDK